MESCIPRKSGGAIPMLMDEYLSTTEERRFILTEDIKGLIVKYQKSYDCDHDYYKYNATAIISSNSEFITIYDYCQQKEFKPGDRVIIRRTQNVKSDWTVREISEPLPKSSEKYGYWQCLSCKYPNAFGAIELVK